MNEIKPKPESNSSACEELRALLPAYVIGAVDADEAARVQTLLEECPEAKVEIGEYAALTAGFYSRIEPTVPPADLHNRLMAKVRSEGAAQRPTPRIVEMSNPPRRDSRRVIGWVLATAAAILLIASNVYWLSRLNGLQTQIASLREQRDQVIELASATDLQRVTLVSTQPNSELALATLLWDARSEDAVLTGLELPSLSADQSYQLWLIGDSNPVSAGVFSTDENGIASLSFSADQPIQSYQAAAISVEPLGGSPAPTTSPIALGSIQT